MVSSGGRVGCSALVMLLVSLGAAVEVYDDAPQMETDLPFQEDNDIDTGPFSRLEPGFPNADDVMLYKLVKGLAQNQLSLQFRRNSFDTPEEENIPDMKPVFKRLPSALRQRLVRPQRKWKIKKGKALGSQMVCYFKLCAFRSPH